MIGLLASSGVETRRAWAHALASTVGQHFLAYLWRIKSDKKVRTAALASARRFELDRADRALLAGAAADAAWLAGVAAHQTAVKRSISSLLWDAHAAYVRSYKRNQTLWKR